MRNSECEDRESKIEISSELGVKNQNINLSGDFARHRHNGWICFFKLFSLFMIVFSQ